MTDFPTMVYRVPGKFKAPGGGTYDFHGADDKAAFDALLRDGWFATIPEAKTGKGVTLSADAMPTREEMEQKAKQLGIRGVHLMKDETLAAKIAERV